MCICIHTNRARVQLLFNNTLFSCWLLRWKLVAWPWPFTCLYAGRAALCDKMCVYVWKHCMCGYIDATIHCIWNENLKCCGYFLLSHLQLNLGRFHTIIYATFLAICWQYVFISIIDTSPERSLNWDPLRVLSVYSVAINCTLCYLAASRWCEVCYVLLSTRTFCFCIFLCCVDNETLPRLLDYITQELDFLPLWCVHDFNIQRLKRLFRTCLNMCRFDFVHFS